MNRIEACLFITLLVNGLVFWLDDTVHRIFDIFTRNQSAFSNQKTKVSLCSAPRPPSKLDNNSDACFRPVKVIKVPNSSIRHQQHCSKDLKINLSIVKKANERQGAKGSAWVEESLRSAIDFLFLRQALSRGELHDEE